MQWRGAEVEPGVEYPEPEQWEAVEVPGRPARFAGADAVAYRATFEEPRTGAESHAVLDLRGVYAEATVWLNGTELGSHDVYFEPFRAELDEHLEAENDLRVVCRRPTDAFGGIYETDAVPERDAVPGIWWDATVRTYPGTYIDRLVARPALDGETGTVTVSASVVADEALDDRITFSVRPEGSRGRGMMERASVSAEAGQRVSVEHTIELREPARWWPAGLGEQNRYVIRAKFDGVERAVTTGFCEVRYDEGQLRVNGQPTTARGVNLVDASPEDVERAVELNANLVRAHAHVPSPAVAEACTESGLLLWQDLPLTGPVQPDVERGQQLATALDRTYGHVPALAALSVHDDPVDSFERPLGSGLIDRLRFRWRTWRASYDDSAATAIAESLPASITQFPVVGQPGIEPDALTLYPGWRYGTVEDLDWLLDRYSEPGVVAEFGAGSLTKAVPEDLSGFDRAVHDAHADGEDVEASQDYQASVCKRVAERLRQEGVAVVAAFALRDTGDAGMGVFGRDGTVKPAAEALARAYAPIQATLSDPTGTESDVVVHNDTGGRIAGTVAWESDAGSDSVEVAVEAGERATAATIELPEPGETVRLRLSLDELTVENEYQI